jgi:hypothetical protein
VAGCNPVKKPVKKGFFQNHGTWLKSVSGAGKIPGYDLPEKGDTQKISLAGFEIFQTFALHPSPTL